ncbi:MAG: hypothetical protein IPJ81_08785 [Chitinophagaceae bacterium]|nr:hypothetical protein [Chitinophagaceae bacterium]
MAGWWWVKRADHPYQLRPVLLRWKNTLKGFLEQRNLRNRVSYSMVFDQEPDPDILGTQHCYFLQL